MILRQHFFRTALCVLSVFCVPFLSAAEPDYTEYAGLLKTYAKPNGVDYAAWAAQKDDLKALGAVLKRMSEVDVSALEPKAQKAFYINLYNVAMLQAVFKHYPLKSVKDIGLIPFSIFKKKFIQQGDRRLSLDDVEKGILLKEHFDPRIHFAVNCASESCPPLRAEPFVAERLDAQLDEQTRAFAESERAARIDTERRKIYYSELFKWYADDFKGETPATYLNRYRSTPLPSGFAVDWINYDWSLNTAE